MLSSILNSPTAINVNIQIIRVFTKMRALLLTHKGILLQLEKIERKLGSHDQQIAVIFAYLPAGLCREKIIGSTTSTKTENWF